MNRPEDLIQHAVATVLDELELLWFHPANEIGGLISPQALGRFITLGMKPGVSDCIILDAPPSHPTARGVAMELKAPGGRPTPRQRAFLDAARTRGWLVSAPTGVFQSLDFLRSCGWQVDSALTRLATRGIHLSDDGIKKHREPDRPASTKRPSARSRRHEP
jgi:hypothetical protein